MMTHTLLSCFFSCLQRTAGRAVPVLLLLCCLGGCASAPTADTKEDPWFAKDKYTHFLVSTALAGALAKNAKNNGHDDCNAALIGFSVTISIGAAKESFDKRYRNTFYSSRDMVWDTAGSLVGSLAGSGCH
jgi:putative lipoprotein